MYLKKFYYKFTSSLQFRLLKQRIFTYILILIIKEIFKFDIDDLVAKTEMLSNSFLIKLFFLRKLLKHYGTVYFDLIIIVVLLIYQLTVLLSLLLEIGEGSQTKINPKLSLASD